MRTPFSTFSVVLAFIGTETSAATSHRVLQQDMYGTLVVGLNENIHVSGNNNRTVRRRAATKSGKVSSSVPVLTNEGEGEGEDNVVVVVPEEVATTTYNVEFEHGLIYQMNDVADSFFQEADGSSKAGKMTAKSGKAHVVIRAGATMSGGDIDLHGAEPGSFEDEFDDDDDEDDNGRHMEQEQEDLRVVYDTETEPTNEDVARHVAALRRHLGVSGTKTVVAVKVTSTAGTGTPTSYGWSTAQLSDFVFGTDGDEGNLKSQYEACSYGKLRIEHPANQNGTGLINGAIEIEVSNPVGDGDRAIRNAVTEAINARFEIAKPTDLADYWMYCLPPEVMGPTSIAYAHIDSWLSVYNNKWCNRLSAQMHEFGHNLNFAHSGEGEDAYADKTGYMGYSYREEDTPKMCFNAAKSWQTGWYADASMSMNLNTGECFIGKLYGINAYEPGNHSRTVLVKVTSGSSGDPENDHEYTFIDFNRREGINEGTREAADQVTVVRAAGGGTSYAHSKSLAELGYGESYMDEDPNGLHVQVLGIHLEESYADVMIGGHHCVAPPTTSPPTPTPPPMAMGCDEDNPDTESCCASSKTCDVGQGNCGSDDECLTGLVCGNNNCYSSFRWGPEGHNCCEPKPAPIVICDEHNPSIASSCCALSKTCDIGQGSCGSDDECLPVLRCGIDNCLSKYGWGPEGHDCCEPAHDPNALCDEHNNSTASSCCAFSKTCDVGQGDCDSHHDCLPGLLCGTDNCLSRYGWGSEGHDCCEPEPEPDALCNEYNPSTASSCCALNKMCDLGQGDCGSDDECLPGLVCGTNNCLTAFGWGPEGHNCCEPEPGPNDTCEDTNPAIGSMYYYYYSCCALSFSCGLGQGNCGSDDQCLPGLVCGTKNCLSDFGWGSEEKNCCEPDPDFVACETRNNACGPEVLCVGEGACCSQFGYCGTSTEHCGACCQNGDCLANIE